MALIKRSSELPTLFSDMFDVDKFFRNDWNNLISRVPAANITENGNEFKIELAIPGLNKEDVKIDVDNNILTISAEKEDKQEEKDEHYTRKEFSYSSFCRSFTLPGTVKEEDIKAKFENGVLRLTLPKKEEAKKKAKKEIKVS